MDAYVAARPDIFFTGRDGSLRSNRVLCQLAGQYAVDCFIGATLQMDGEANSSTVTLCRISGFGGAPNMGHDPHGRRHATPASLCRANRVDFHYLGFLKERARHSDFMAGELFRRLLIAEDVNVPAVVQCVFVALIALHAFADARTGQANRS